MRPGRGVVALLLGLAVFGLTYAVGWAAGPHAGRIQSADREGSRMATTPDGPVSGTTPGNGASLLAARPSPETPCDLILRCQLPSGAFRLKPDDSRIIPYFANLAAVALVGSHADNVRRYLEWYLAGLNGPDRWGLDGTIYDYALERDGGERPTGTYDSADSYAATFLTLLRRYLDVTSDVEFVGANLPAVRRVAAVITALQDKDGLVWAKANRREKYLMDNAENYRGLTDYAAVLARLGLSEEASLAAGAAERVKGGVEARLWNAERGTYDWAIYTLWLGHRRLGEISRPSGWERWYPDAVAQVFPVVSGLLEPSDPRAVALYGGLNASHPGWVSQAKPDPHPWSVLGYAAAIMGDAGRARMFVGATADSYLQEHGPYSGLSWELGYHLLTADRLGEAGRPAKASERGGD
jgi:hypothetical protein